MAPGDVARKDRKALKEGVAAAAAALEAQNASWAETDKKLLAKDRRAQERDAKADAKLAARCERKAMEAAEEVDEPKNKKNQTSTKITQAELARRQALLAASAKAKAKPAKSVTVPQPKLEPNRNRERDVVEANSLEDALAALDRANNGGDEAGSGRRGMTFVEFEKQTLAELREEKPGLKLSQLREHVLKLWARSPDNPARAG
mmetsp:Transcript_81477/g.205033  ORF Transcript_81477/g.205033 Transcript_81477/m.205033 type:complete len:204 (-) Transcript_81477:117-728(-)|eukprot:CAMPEP_0115232484 /NCGR_PEP_ID=MMETSP0270-20121206/33791_1 /TAXON_ID=71861 /ORGANISM="Scrippsiella trochoidea, Strain CCMP3099" /LENGTH=203 /DNA_ID=CAMNT_0002647181 /DNA_START=83 /DNA_END=694 /DNA_ORIENTATION=-